LSRDPLESQGVALARMSTALEEMASS